MSAMSSETSPVLSPGSLHRVASAGSPIVVMDSPVNASSFVPFARSESLRNARTQSAGAHSPKFGSTTGNNTATDTTQDHVSTRSSLTGSSLFGSTSASLEDDRVYSLQGQLFHAMISYRVATEGDGGNGLSMALYREIHRLSVTSKPLPLGSHGQWPTFAARPEHSPDGQAKVYLDACCLIDGEPWERGASGDGGFIGGVSSAMVFVPLMSWYPDGSGFVGRMTSLNSAEGKDWVDNCLLELIVAIELLAMPTTHLGAILPILVGEKDASGRFGAFPFAKLGQLSNSPSHMTNKRALELIEVLGLTSQLAPGKNGQNGADRVMERSVRGVIDEINKNQGVQLVMEGIANKAIVAAAGRVLDVVADKARQMGERGSRAQLTLDRHLLGKPQAHEVHDWLVANRLTKYATVVAAHSIDSLRLLSHLAEHTHALDDIHHETSRILSEESRVKLRLLWGDFNRLRDKVLRLKDDPLTEPLNVRYAKFRDHDNTTLAATFIDCAPEMGMGVPVIRLATFSMVIVHMVIFYNTTRRFIEYDASQILWSQDFIEYGSFGKKVLRWGLVFNCAQVGVITIILGLSGWVGGWKSDPHNMQKKLLLGNAIVVVIGSFITYGLLLLQCHQTVGIYEYCNGLGNYYIPQGMLHVWLLIVYVHFPRWFWTVSIIVPIVGLSLAGWLFDNTFYQGIACAAMGWLMCYLGWYRKTVWETNWSIAADVQDHRASYRAMMENNEGKNKNLDRTMKTLTSITDEVNLWSNQELRKLRTPTWWMQRLVGLNSPMGGKKVQQRTCDLELLMDLAIDLNFHFQDLVVGWLPHGVKHQAGPVKRPLRAMQKAKRDYAGDVSCLTDLVRCAIKCKSLEEALNVLCIIMAKSSISNAREDTYKAINVADEERVLRVVRVKNRFDPKYNDLNTCGYRDLAILVEVGWVATKNGMCWFVPVSHWDDPTLSIDRLICEVQIQVIHDVQDEKFKLQHQRYLNYRDRSSR